MPSAEKWSITAPTKPMAEEKKAGFLLVSPVGRQGGIPRENP